MRKIFTVLLMLSLPLIFGITAYAETSVTITPSADAEAGEVTIVDWSAGGSAQSEYVPAISDTGAAVHAVPVRDITAEPRLHNVETVTENGVVIVKKTYEAEPDAAPQRLAQSFEQDGHSFHVREILRRELPGEVLTRQAAKTAITESDTDNMAVITKHFPDTIDYEDDGYTGRLYLDASTFKTGADGYETYTYSYTKTREIPGLDRNDPAYIEREWNGMALSGVSFKQGADGKYTATAAYKGAATGKREKGYVTTAVYRGEITKTNPGNILYTVIYEGTPIPIEQAAPAEQEQPAPLDDTGEGAEPAEAAASTEPPATPAEEKRPGYLFPIIAGIIFLAGAVIVPFYMAKQFRKERTQTHEEIEELKSIIRGREE